MKAENPVVEIRLFYFILFYFSKIYQIRAIFFTKKSFVCAKIIFFKIIWFLNLVKRGYISLNLEYMHFHILAMHVSIVMDLFKLW